MLEQCLAWGGEQRLRLQVVLAVSPGMPALHLLPFRCSFVTTQRRQCIAA